MKKFLTTFLFSLVLIFFATTNFTSANDAEDQTASVIVSDTNAASITSPMPDETVTSTVPETQSATSPANDWTFTDSFESHIQGDLDGQGGWKVTNYDGNPENTVDIATTNQREETRYVEITNNDSVITTHDVTPINAGIFQLRMRHNKSGLFYLYALTSDAGGQLLFSIQFTESNGILLEEVNEQITLLPDYNANQWYLFTIDFDNRRGEKGTFKIKIDDGDYSEFEYVNSQSAIFDFAQMVFGSESGGGAVSAFGDIKSSPIISTLTADINDTATSTITTVDIDGTSIVTTSTDTSTDISTTETTNTDQLANVISALDDTVSAISEDSSVTTSTEEPTATIIVSDTNAPSLTSPLSNEMTTSIVPEETPTTSSVTGDTNTNGTTTTTF